MAADTKVNNDTVIRQVFQGLEATAQVQEQMLDLSSDKVNPLLQTYFLSFPLHPISQALARSVFLMSSLSYATVLNNL